MLSNILKGTGATVTAGTLAGGTYLFNKVLKMFLGEENRKVFIIL